MCVNREEIEKAIPHRPPFLLLDEVVEQEENRILCRYTPRAEDELFGRVYAGHYPGAPITPGVLLCEMIFQAAAVLMSAKAAGKTGVPVLVKIGSAKFKRPIRPGETVEIEAKLDETVANAYYMSGSVKAGGQLAVRVEFACALAEMEK